MVAKQGCLSTTLRVWANHMGIRTGSIAEDLQTLLKGMQTTILSTTRTEAHNMLAVGATVEIVSFTNLGFGGIQVWCQYVNSDEMLPCPLLLTEIDCEPLWRPMWASLKEIKQDTPRSEVPQIR